MRRTATAAALAVVLGIGLRAYHYLRDPVVWHDEAAVTINVIEKDYAALLGPLRLHQAAPPLFLWVEKATSEAFGDEALAMRFPLFAISCLTLILFVPLAWRLLPTSAVAWSVLLFAVSDNLSRHACETKPYAFDVFCATALAALYVGVEKASFVTRALVLAAAAPIALWLSYPACFVCGGCGVALALALERDRRWRNVAALGVLGATIAIAFLALMLGPAHAQRQDGPLTALWIPHYPDWSRAWTVPGWILHASFGVAHYACKPIGLAVLALATLGAVELWRGGRRECVALLVVPILLSLIAGCLRLYPYGHFRLSVFATPALLLMTAAALPGLFARLASHRPIGTWAAWGLTAVLAIPVGHALVRLGRPWPVADTRGAAAFVEAQRRPDDPVVGNDWTHEYYFRRLGGAFRPTTDAPPIAGERLWVVWTEQASPEERLRAAARHAPPDWDAIERIDTRFTTAILFAKSANGAGVTRSARP